MDILPKDTISQSPDGVKNNSEEKNPRGFGAFKSNLQLPQLTQMGQNLQEARWPVALSAGILFLTLIIWAGFFFYYSSLEKKKDSLNKRIEELNTKESKEMTARILDLEGDLKSANNLLNSHVYSSRALRFLEDNILPNVQLKEFKLDIKTGQISSGGMAQTYNVLAKQILLLEKQEVVKSVRASGIALDKLGGVGFKIDILLKDKFFTK